MPRFEVEIEGDDLGNAMIALNDAGILIIASGNPGQTGGAGFVGRRFFLRTPFWVLVVILIAFFAQRIGSAGEEERTYDQFLTQIERSPETLDQVTLDPDDETIEVIESDDTEYTVGHPTDTEQELVDRLSENGVETVVEGSGGGGPLGFLLFLLPFVLMIVFWLFLLWQKRRGGKMTPSASSWNPRDLRAVVEADSQEAAGSQVRQQLPNDAARVGRVTGSRF